MRCDKCGARMWHVYDFFVVEGGWLRVLRYYVCTSCGDDHVTRKTKKDGVYMITYKEKDK